MSEKTAEIRENLFYKKKNGYEKLSPERNIEINKFAEGYKRYLDTCKTEREAASEAVKMASVKGFTEYKSGNSVVPGCKYYSLSGEKLAIFVRIGKKPISEGINIIASHIDAPRLDLKPNPLYEESELAMFKTHYYGGIRKYQWLAVPLELRGVVVKPDGEKIKVSIGSEPDDPVFCVSDLLPHLAREQGTKPLNTAYTGENLNALVGSVPYDDDGTDRTKLAVLSILNDKYGITEEDFLSAELSLVPAANARDVGLDRSLIGAYGQDDRVCAYSSLAAFLDSEEIPEKTSMVILADKEEIGSDGITGMKSNRFDHFVSSLCGGDTSIFNECLNSSVCLSCDVSAAYDPNFPEVFEKNNSAFLNKGISVCKYTGSGGKSGASDANAETVAKLRKIFADNDVAWQICELGKVDVGGGGTVAKYMAERGIETIDAGTPVISMHAPYEVTSKFDVYMTYLASKAFLTL